MLDQAQVYKLFGEVDRLPGIMEPRIGRWRAWPMAKMQLLWHLLYVPASVERNLAVSWLSKVRHKLPRYAGALPLIWRRPDLRPPPRAVGMLYVPRIHCCRDGRSRDLVFGDLLSGAGVGRPVVALRHPPVGYRSSTVSWGSTIDLEPYHSICEQLALLLMSDSSIRRAGADLNHLLDEFDIPIDRRLRGRKVLLALTLFEARRRVFRRLYAQLGLAALVVSYAPGRHGEVAAARELGLPVIELQHGIFGTHCPDYAWPPDAKRCKDAMPLPDRIAVFGQKFRKLMLTSGFWDCDEVVATGAAVMDGFRLGSSGDGRRPGPLRLIFMSQPTVRNAAIDFWRELLASPGFLTGDYQVAFKAHPEEERHIAAYRELVGAAPGRFTLLPEDVNPVDAMLDADVVLSYNSMALVEAIGMGRPAVSLCGGPVPHGFAGSFGLPDIINVMPHVTSSGSLLKVLVERAGSQLNLAAWQHEIQSLGKDFFSDGFSANTVGLINEVAQAPNFQQ